MKSKEKIVTLYLLVSGGVGLIYMGLLYILDSVAGYSPAVSVTGAYVTAMSFYFIINKLVIFGRFKSGRSGREFLQFALVVTVNYFVTRFIVQGIHALTGEVYSGSVLAGVITISLTYLVFDRIVFKTRD
ncbi:MAG: hypothetical protein GF401_08910 [Chitinivibrionales bacterium]|nr:hypothetical protein [Chitinivibrionales bacterium]